MEYVVGKAAVLAGTLLAAGFHGILWNGQFDLDFAQCRFHLADPRGGRPCMNCDARIDGPPIWTDCTSPPANGWAGRTYTNESYAAITGDLRHRLFRVLPVFGAANFGGGHFTLQVAWSRPIFPRRCFVAPRPVLYAA